MHYYFYCTFYFSALQKPFRGVRHNVNWKLLGSSFMHKVRLKPLKCIRIISDTNWKLLSHREILEAQGNKFFTVHVQNNTGSHRPSFFKGTQAWDNLDFFLPKSNPYMPFLNFHKKFRFFSFDFCLNFYVRTFPRWLSIRGTKFFWDISKNFFSSKSSLWSYKIGS